MPKVPYASPVLQYRLCGEEYVAEKTFLYILVREVVPKVTVRELQSLSESNKQLAEKLCRCPFLVLVGGEKNIAVSMNEVQEEWDHGTHPLLDVCGGLSDEMNLVVVNVDAPITHYECDTMGYSFKEAGQLFCSIMGFPWRLSKDMQWLSSVRSTRNRNIRVQIDRSRVVLGNKGHYACYNGGDFTLLNEFE